MLKKKKKLKIEGLDKCILLSNCHCHSAFLHFPQNVIFSLVSNERFIMSFVMSLMFVRSLYSRPASSKRFYFLISPSLQNVILLFFGLIKCFKLTSMFDDLLLFTIHVLCQRMK